MVQLNSTQITPTIIIKEMFSETILLILFSILHFKVQFILIEINCFMFFFILNFYDYFFNGRLIIVSILCTLNILYCIETSTHN